MYIDLLLIVITAALFLIPILAPKGKWFWVSSLVIFLLLAYGWAQHFYYASQSDYDYGNAAGAALGEFIAIVITSSFLLGLGVRLCIWAVKKKILNAKSQNT